MFSSRLHPTVRTMETSTWFPTRVPSLRAVTVWQQASAWRSNSGTCWESTIARFVSLSGLLASNWTCGRNAPSSMLTMLSKSIPSFVIVPVLSKTIVEIFPAMGMRPGCRQLILCAEDRRLAVTDCPMTMLTGSIGLRHIATVLITTKYVAIQSPRSAMKMLTMVTAINQRNMMKYTAGSWSLYLNLTLVGKRTMRTSWPRVVSAPTALATMTALPLGPVDCRQSVPA
mmetsp:Transcript_60879/g.173036  ORF Transcript_60879/g.173036 Transcript_60879/m.173036 type:complete len:228 (+) Transcript_60879:1855-2538(+)